MATAIAETSTTRHESSDCDRTVAGAYKVVAIYRGVPKLCAWRDDEQQAIAIAEKIVSRGLPASVHTADGLPVWSPAAQCEPMDEPFEHTECV